MPLHMLFLMLGQFLPFSSMGSQDPGQASAPERPPSSSLPVSPTLFATIKTFLYSGAIAHLFVFPQETMSSMRQELGLLSFWFPCALHGAWFIYIWWLNEQAAEGNCSSAILNLEKITVCTGHRVNARAMPLTRKAYRADLCSSYLVWSVKRMTPRNYYIP